MHFIHAWVFVPYFDCANITGMPMLEGVSSMSPAPPVTAGNGK
jgi:hypothetical protein